MSDGQPTIVAQVLAAGTAAGGLAATGASGVAWILGSAAALVVLGAVVLRLAHRRTQRRSSQQVSS
ncbi:hypothetical protein Cch01nite_13020 [Cellulomonas chitinilytica]|uniref:Uncharacterized protein n=1 Tax=Cellulomonas chitinilytica TaxID=398759 RepID=A0A919P2A6_9CELL|nr:hypothetical protein [Cellulomonas chitinilytica]GIG20578.1 hypothetical protein Cch01nite_13020 [Cellulomonas chitinilytica]